MKSDHFVWIFSLIEINVRPTMNVSVKRRVYTSTLELFIGMMISIVVLSSLIRIMGREEISQIIFFNLVSAIIIGTLSG